MRLLVWVIIILMGFIGLGLNTLKKYTMVGFGKIEIKDALNIRTWLRLFTNPLAVLSLTIALFSWVVSMWTLSLTDMGKLNAVVMGLAIPFMFLNVVVGILMFKEGFGRDQIIGLSLISVAMVISIVGSYFAGGGVEA